MYSMIGTGEQFQTSPPEPYFEAAPSTFQLGFDNQIKLQNLHTYKERIVEDNFLLCQVGTKGKELKQGK